MKTITMIMVIGLLLTTHAVFTQDLVQKKEYESELARLRQSLVLSKKKAAGLEKDLLRTMAMTDSLVVMNNLNKAHMVALADTMTAMKAAMRGMEESSLKNKRIPVALTASLSGFLALALLGLLYFSMRGNRRFSRRIDEMVRLREKDAGDVASGLAVVSDRIRQCHDRLENTENTLNYRINSGLTAHDTRILLLERHNAEKYSQILSNIDALNGAIAASRVDLTTTIDKLASMERELAGRVVTIEKELHH